MHLGSTTGETKLERLARVLVSLALRGDLRAAALVMERVEGKVPDRIQGSASVLVRVVYEDKLPVNQPSSPAIDVEETLAKPVSEFNLSPLALTVGLTNRSTSRLTQLTPSPPGTVFDASTERWDDRTEP